MSHPLRSPRVLTGESMNRFEAMVECFLRHSRNGTIGSPEGQAEMARYARELSATYVGRCFWDRRKR